MKDPRNPQWEIIDGTANQPPKSWMYDGNMPGKSYEELLIDCIRLEHERDELRAHIERFDRRSCMECDFSGPDTDEVIKGWKAND